MKIYVIHLARNILQDEHNKRVYESSILFVGFFTELETAKKVVEENWGDLCECGYYHYAIIEEIHEGLYAFFENPLIYKWEGTIEDGKYQQLK